MPTSNSTLVEVTAQELTAAARMRVFFGHQSVGGNLLEAAPGVFAAHNVTAPQICDAAGVSGDGGCLLHAAIGANEEPLFKIEDFARQVRGGVGAQVEVAMMKLCYIDVVAGTDVETLFAAYRDTLTELADEFPAVRFVATTVPLTTDMDAQDWIKAGIRTLLGRASAGYAPADNVARERLNTLIRHEYPGGRLFDLAAVESTAPDGARVGGRYHGSEYFALYRGYASDAGHLNQPGARAAASAWLAAIAQTGAR